MHSVFPGREQAAWITALRPARNRVDPFRPHGFFLEQERTGAGQVVSSGVILLTNKECPWRCLMCDLWKNTTTQTVPRGAIPEQIRYALSRLESSPKQMKLYNSGSFFDPAAIPPEDYSAIALAVSSAEHVVVESHPRLVGEKAVRFRDLLAGSLEVALGLETVHPQVLPRLNKKFTLTHFASAVEFLREQKMLVRVFVLVKPPFMNETKGLKWAVKSAEFAFNCGANVVSLIPTRPGNGALERLMEAGEFAPPRLSTLEKAQELALNIGRGRVFADTWDLCRFSKCPTCLGRRSARIQATNLSQQIQPAVRCSECDEA
ncbi:MAG TPA: radical SAM protein [Verrucomicrobiae bacterium]|nr:radical SAM protein [Verrucomicrobiae bacterium]